MMEATVEASVLEGTFRAAEMKAHVSSIFESGPVTEFVLLNIEKQNKSGWTQTKANVLTLVP